MKKALQILYGSSSGGDSQESQYLLHRKFCGQYSVTSDYSSLNYLGTNALGSLSLICFPTDEKLIEVSSDTSLPDKCFQNILSFLQFEDQMSARAVMKPRRTGRCGYNNNGADLRRPGCYSLDPMKLRTNVLAPKIPEVQVKYVNMEMSDEENQYIDISIEEPDYFDIIGIVNSSKVVLCSTVATCSGIVFLVFYLIFMK